MSITELRERVEYLRGRVENAERIGRPAHIERCRSRYEGASAVLAARTSGGE